MFKFDEYPELKKAYREFTKLNRILYKEERKIKPDDEESEVPAQKAFENLEAFSDIFSQLIFNTFRDKKPRLYSQAKDRFAEWDKVFPDKWENFDEKLKNELLSLVLEVGYGEYWLPDEYYDDKLIDGCLPPPPTHTKPWNFGCG